MEEATGQGIADFAASSVGDDIVDIDGNQDLTSILDVDEGDGNEEAEAEEAAEEAEAAEVEAPSGSAGRARKPPKHFTQPERELFRRLWPNIKRMEGTARLDFGDLAAEWMVQVDPKNGIHPRNAVLLEQHWEADKRVQNQMATLQAARGAARVVPCPWFDFRTPKNELR